MTSIILRIIMASVGVILLMINFVYYAKKKISETVGLGWSVFAILMIVISCVPVLSGWSKVMSGVNYISFFLIFLILIIGLFIASVQISQLTMKNQELAMHVSLLNQENETMLRKLKILDSERQERLRIKEQLHEKDIIYN